MYGFIPISNIFQIYKKFYHRFITDYKGPLLIARLRKYTSQRNKFKSSLKYKEALQDMIAENTFYYRK